MLNQKTVRANTVEEAIEMGLKELNIDRSQAEIRVINEGKKGFLGFGKQEAIVEIVQNNDISLKELTKQLERESTEESVETTEKIVEQEVYVETTEYAIESQEAEVEAAELAIEKDELEVEATESSVEEAESEVEVAESVIEEAEAEVEIAEVTAEEETISETGTTNEVESIPFQGKNAYESAAIVAEYLVAVVREYGAEAEIEMDIEGRNVFFDIHTDKSGLVIGKHGKIINSLQILAQTYLSAIHQRHLNVILNVGDYRKRRAKVLQNIAEQKAEEAMQTGKPVVIDALPAYERKQIHKHLAHMKNIKTYSQGREPKRHLVVEYQETSNN
ncbi:Jag N-terminal domain-containing protein [Aerococcaceae bacterium DSM 111022]|nr:Jag N-terminal domain-containing protein [Aerococcaceae bacterium DSM 111022]